MVNPWALRGRSVAAPDVRRFRSPDHVPYEPIHLRKPSIERLHRRRQRRHRDGRKTRPGLGCALAVGADEEVRLTVLDQRDVPAVIAMLGRCSRATLYRRFHGFTDGVAHASQTLAGLDQHAYGAWSGGRCIGMASLAVDGEDYGDIGVLVEDAVAAAWRRLSAYRRIGGAGPSSSASVASWRM